MTDDEQAIRELVSTWMKASEVGDINTVLSLMADDVIFMVPGRAPFGKEQFSVTLVKNERGSMRLIGTDLKSVAPGFTFANGVSGIR